MLTVLGRNLSFNRIEEEAKNNAVSEKLESSEVKKSTVPVKIGHFGELPTGRRSLTRDKKVNMKVLTSQC